MRKVLAILLFFVFAAAVVDALRDHTENRPDAAVTGTRSVVTFDVDTYDAQQPIAEAARALWYMCNETIGNRLIDLQIGDGGNGVATVEPALGSHARRRLTGCLKDATIDRVRGDVVSVVDTAPA
jgi:hypothetical protein